MARTTFSGLILALLSAATFGSSGAVAKSLLDAGWSPAAAVTVRVALGALVLLPLAIASMRGRWHLLPRATGNIIGFGVAAVAACQLAYFEAVTRLPVGVALMLEYLGPVLVVGWFWLRHGRRPSGLTTGGVLLSLGGLLLVLDILGPVQLDLIGVLWGLLAAVGLAAYFIIGGDDRSGVPPLVVATGGLLVGTFVLGLAGLVGLTDMTWSTEPVQLLGASTAWWWPVLWLGVASAAVSYGSGVAATRLLGATVASFVGLTEVMFAVLVAWLLLAELPAPVQLVGGALIVIGVIAVKTGERRPASEPSVSRPAVSGLTAAVRE